MRSLEFELGGRQYHCMHHLTLQETMRGLFYLGFPAKPLQRSVDSAADAEQVSSSLGSKQQ